MSETVKLIIEIPKSALELLKTTGVDWLGAEHILSAVAEGVPLDDVKAEIEKLKDPLQVPCGKNYFSILFACNRVIDILDSIGKGDKE